MSTFSVPTARTIVLPDPRRARGKHRAPRFAVLADRTVAAYRRVRFEALTVAAAAGAVLVAAHGITL